MKVLIQAQELRVGDHLEGKYEVLELALTESWMERIRATILLEDATTKRVIALNRGDVVQVLAADHFRHLSEGLLGVLGDLVQLDGEGLARSSR